MSRGDCPSRAELRLSSSPSVCAFPFSPHASEPDACPATRRCGSGSQSHKAGVSTSPSLGLACPSASVSLSSSLLTPWRPGTSRSPSGRRRKKHGASWSSLRPHYPPPSQPSFEVPMAPRHTNHVLNAVIRKLFTTFTPRYLQCAPSRSSDTSLDSRS